MVNKNIESSGRKSFSLKKLITHNFSLLIFFYNILRMRLSIKMIKISKNEFENIISENFQLIISLF